MRKVRLLLSAKSNVQYYVDAVNKLGADATAKYLPDIDIGYDGLILCGGSDIDPQYYGEEINGSVNIDKKRDSVEFELLRAYVDAGKPALGICRGYQLINVFFGGSLYQHLPETAFHRGEVGVDAVHSVAATSGSILYNLYGSNFYVNSAHHQAVKTLGQGLVATAYWNDKYIEAYEHVSMPIFGVQWHPERMCFAKARDDTVCGAKIFEHFIAMCVR